MPSPVSYIFWQWGANYFSWPIPFLLQLLYHLLFSFGVAKTMTTTTHGQLLEVQAEEINGRHNNFIQLKMPSKEERGTFVCTTIFRGPFHCYWTRCMYSCCCLCREYQNNCYLFYNGCLGLRNICALVFMQYIYTKEKGTENKWGETWLVYK